MKVSRDPDGVIRAWDRNGERFAKIEAGRVYLLWMEDGRPEPDHDAPWVTVEEMQSLMEAVNG